MRNPAFLRRWVRAYAAATATTTSYDKIRDAATSGGEAKPAKTTTIAYRDALERWILDPVPERAPTNDHLRRLVAASKRLGPTPWGAAVSPRPPAIENGSSSVHPKTG